MNYQVPIAEGGADVLKDKLTPKAIVAALDELIKWVREQSRIEPDGG
jgi:hypothetical protein